MKKLSLKTIYQEVVCKKSVWMIITIITMTFLTFTSVVAKGKTGKEMVLRHTLKNGLKVIIVRNPLAPVVTTEVNYNVGSNEAPKGFPGMAHAQEHMMFRGSPGLSADQITDIGAAMGGSFDADTRNMVTQYYFTVPAEDIDIALHIESLRMKDVFDSQKLWKKERGAIEQEVARDLSSPVYVFFKDLLAATFKGTPYAHDALGTRPSFNKTTGAMLKKFYNKWYAPNNATLVIVGKVNPRKTLREVEKLFGNIPSKELPKRPVFHFQPVKPDTLHLKTDLPFGVVLMSFRMPGTDSPDYAAAKILSDVLANQRGKLYGLVPQGKALNATFETQTFRKAGLGFGLALFPKYGDAKGLLSDVSKVMIAEARNGVNPDLVKAAKLTEISTFEFQRNSVSGLASVWSQAVAVEGRKSPAEDLQALKKVTVKDVNRVARKYLNPQHAIYAILTPHPSGKPISRKGFGGKESFGSKNPKQVKLPKWAKKAIGRMVVPKSIINPVVSTLPNGIKLIVQPETITNTVSIYGRIKNNPYLETPEKQEGVDNVLNRLFNFGSTSLNRIQFHKALDDIGAKESAGSNFSLSVLRNHFDRGVHLLAQNELHPALPPRAFMIFQHQLAAELVGQLQSPDYLFNKAIHNALYPKGDPALRHATPSSVKSLNLSDVKNYYQKTFRPDMTSIVVIGNIKPDTAKKVIEKYFGDWHVNGKKPKVEFSKIPVNKSSVINVPDASRIQDKVALAEDIELTRSNPDYYTLTVGNYVLSGAPLASILWRDLRGNTGLVYGVSSSFHIGKHRSMFSIDYGCDPPNVTKAKNIIVRDLKQMQTKNVTPKELRQAKSQLLRQIPLSESSVRAIANGLLNRSVKGIPLNEPTIAAKHYINTTANQVKTAFTKWVNVKNLVLVTQGPQPK